MLALILAVVLSEPPSIVWTAVPSGEMIAVECAGDVNGDGTEDVFVASTEEAALGIMCLDGLTGETIWSSNEFPPGALDRDCFRSVPDADLDDITDLAVALQAENTVVMISGASGEVLWSILQDNSVEHLESISGPGSGDAAVIITDLVPPYWYNIRARDATDGGQLWVISLGVTADRWSRTTEDDVSGNGWAEIGYSIDRGTASGGSAVVVDGYSGVTIGNTSAMYIPTMDITGDCGGIMAISHWGDYPTIWFESIPTGDTIWSSNSDDMVYPILQFVPNGAGSYYPDILGLDNNEMTLIRGSDGYHADSYFFPGNITSVECYNDTPIWYSAVSTDNTFHCPELVYEYPSTMPAINLPGTGASDMCLLESDQYPTPLAAISRAGSGPGVCAICTSWPLEIEDEPEIEATASQIRLLSNPCRGVLSLYAETDTDLLIIDLAGRVSYNGTIEEDQQMNIELPPGLYVIINRGSGMVLNRAIVLPD